MVIITVIITIKRNLPCAKQVQKHLQKHQFPSNEIHVCPSAPPKASTQAVHKSVISNHYNTLIWFVEKYPSTEIKRNHLIICEDDCEFLPKKPVWSKVRELICYLDSEYSDWATFHIGHCPIGPTLPTRHPELVHSFLPYAAHCYAMNGYQMQQLLKQNPNRQKWTRPQAFEGWLMLPVRQKFASYPILATQNRLPKEVKDFKLMQMFGLTNWIHVMEYVMLYGVQAVCLALLLWVLVRLIRRK